MIMELDFVAGFKANFLRFELVDCDMLFNYSHLVVSHADGRSPAPLGRWFIHVYPIKIAV